MSPEDSKAMRRIEFLKRRQVATSEELLMLERLQFKEREESRVADRKRAEADFEALESKREARSAHRPSPNNGTSSHGR